MPGPLDEIQNNLKKYSQNPYVKAGVNPYLSASANPYMNTGGSTTDAQLAPYVDQAAADAAVKRNSMTPLQAVLDLLNRGQYLTANMAAARQAGKPFGEVLAAGGRGITGQEKGDWRQVLFGGKTAEGDIPGLIPWTPETDAGKRIQDLASLAANILLDPTTYVGFGATKGAKASARVYARDATNLAMERIARNAPDALKNFSSETLQGLVSKGNMSAAERYLSQSGGADLARELNRIYKSAYKEGVRLNPEDLVAKLQPQVAEVRDSIAKQIEKNFAGKQAKLPAINDYYKQLEQGQGAFGNLLNTERYAGSGTRSASFLGAEFGASTRYPAYVQAYDKAVQSLKDSTLGGVFAKAAWSVAGPNTPIGKLKEAFGFRNPYQQMIRSMERDMQEIVPHNTSKYVNEIKNITENFDEKQLNAIADAMETSQNDPNLWRSVLETHPDMAGKDVGKATDAVLALNELTAGWRAKLQEGVDEGILSSIGDIVNYLPIRTQGGDFYKQVGTLRGTKSPGFTRTRQLGWEGNRAAEIRKMEVFQGVDHATAVELVNRGIGTQLETDLRRMLVGRAIAQSKAEMRIDLIRGFRDMGVDMRPVMKGEPSLSVALGRPNATIPSLGLKTVDDPSLTGYFFDREVADVLQRAVKITSSDAGLQNMGKMLDSFTSWIKGWLTLSPGFHIRNAQGNTFTGFMKFGPRWFDPRTVYESTVATFTGLYGKDRMMAALGKAGISPDKLESVLKQTYGGKTLEQLADIASQKGVISRATMGYDIPSTIDQMVGKKGTLNLLSNKNIAFKASHAVGNVVESTPRFQMFLMDWKDLAGKTSPEAALDYAKNEAKKWFMDYGDLTEFERKVMRKIVPFYCVPDDTEILTQDGWKRHEELTVGETVLTYNVDSDLQEWQPIEDIARFEFDGDLVRMSGQFMDFRCTEDHRWPIEVARTFVKRKWYGGNKKIVRTNELNTSHRFILSAQTSYPQESILGPRDATILGWLVTDGYSRIRGNYVECMIYQKKQPELNRIRELLGEYLSSESVHPTTGVHCLRIKIEWYRRIAHLYKTKDDLPAIASRLNRESAEGMWDAMMAAEGFVHATKGVQFVQAVGPVLDAFQILSQLLNRPFSYAIRQNRGKPMASGYVRSGNRVKNCYVKKTKEAYNGIIWCPRTKNSTWIMRQNGSVICTGNTWVRKNLANQVDLMIHTPELYSLIPKVQNAVSDQNSSQNDLPEWMKQANYLPLAPEWIPEGWKGGVTALWPNLPYGDINNVPVSFEMSPNGVPIPILKSPFDAMSDIVSQAHPALKTAFEVLPPEPYDVYFKSTMGKEKAIPGISRFPKALAFLDGLLKDIGVTDGLNIKMDKSGKMLIDSKIATVIDENLPILNQLDRWISAPAELVPVIDDIRSQTYNKNKEDAINKLFSVMSFDAGIKLKQVNLSEQQKRDMEDIMREAEKKRLEARKNLPGYQTRSNQYWAKRAARVRRVVGGKYGG